MSNQFNKVKTLFVTIIVTNLLNNNILCFELTFSHSINDCYFLCFTIELCIKECQSGFRSHSNTNKTIAMKTRKISSSDSSLKVSQLEKTSDKKKDAKSFEGSNAFESPPHCGLRTRTRTNSRYRNRFMGRIVGGM